MTTRSDMTRQDAYKKEARDRWGHTAAYAQFAQKSAGRSPKEEGAAAEGLMAIFAEFAACKAAGYKPHSPEAGALVQKFQGYITRHYYTCNEGILFSLGRMYVADDRFRQNIDAHGPLPAESAGEAIRILCER